MRREGDEHPLSQHGNETEAERAAAWHAAQTGAPAIFLHDRYHRVRPIWTARERGDRDRRRAGEVITA